MSFNLIETLAWAAVGLWVGRQLVRRIPVLHRLCLPEPVLGGLCLAAVWGGLEGLFSITVSFDQTLQLPFMIAFFLSIGWLASFRNLKAGGPEVIKFLLLCSAVLVLQNAIGMGLAAVLGQNRLLGVLAGSVSMAGGPGTALAFAPVFENAGVVGAGSIGTACALMGILLGGLLGAPLGAGLISGLKPSTPKVGGSTQAKIPEDAPSVDAQALDRAEASLITHLKFFLVVMALGSLVGKWIQDSGVTLPIYIGSMGVAAVARNVVDLRQEHGKKAPLSADLIDELGSICLAYFLVVATMTLQFKQLSALAGVLVVVLAVQAIVALVVARFVVFRYFGRDFDAAVMSGGFVGFTLGTTANAVANMNALSGRFSNQFGNPARAFLVVPLVGACFIDFVNALVITFLTHP